MSQMCIFDLLEIIATKDIELFRKYIFQYVRQASKPYFSDGMKIGHPFNLSDAVNELGKEIIPDELGIYHLFLDDHLVYVGMSKNLRERLLYHLKDDEMPFDNVLWFCGNDFKDKTIKDVLQIEKNLIKRLRPPLNMRHYSTNKL
jgi:hypothetical protein